MPSAAKSGKLPVIGITVGDAAGIGPELAVKAVSNDDFRRQAEFVLYGPGEVIAEAWRRWGKGEYPKVVSFGNLKFADLAIGKADPVCGKIAYDALSQATLDALARKIDAIVTAPMNKYSVNLARIPFTGHTERIAELCRVEDYVMMQSAGDLRVVFVTTHIALNEVAKEVTLERIVKVTELLDNAVRSDGIKHPKIAIAGLNPHAGENGFMGTEDETVVKPAVARLKELGFDVTGPFPSDTLFIGETRRQFDGIVSMYHDQGHIPFKMLAFDRGVNSTLGLPVIRTSPDHGTAFAIAWQGVADTGSFDAALTQAIRRAKFHD